MIILIPLGGKGERFKKNGYKMPKALINVFGKPIIFWLLDSLINLNNQYAKTFNSLTFIKSFAIPRVSRYRFCS